MTFGELFVNNKIVTTVLFACLLAQSAKIIYLLVTTKKIDLKRFIGTGGMPSSHAATVMSLLTCIGRTSGIESSLFAVTFVFAMVTLYDATGIRRAAGHQAEVLNKIIENWEEGETLRERRLKELLGHTPMEVFWGCLLGIAVGMLASL